MKPPPRRTPTSERSRLRLVVVRVLVFSLFATLFARLYYLQVVSGDAYHAAAASQSLREVVVQPQRGLIVDDQGRPLVANRTAWAVSVDRTLLDRLSEHDRAVVLDRLAAAVHTPLRRVKQALVTCGDPGSVRGRCWNGSPYQPVPVALDVRQSVALRILEQPEDYPAVVAQQQSLRSYPSPYGVNLADIVGYLSPITAGELSHAQQAPRHVAQRAPAPWAAPGSSRSTTATCAAGPATSGSPSTRWAGCSATTARCRAGPATPWSPRSTPRSRPPPSGRWHDAITTARATYDPVTHRNYRADSGAAIVLQARTGRVVAMASQPTYDPARCGSAASPASSSPGSTRQVRRRPAAGPGATRASSRPARPGSRS